MTRGQISAGRRWISRLFAGWSGPESVDDVVVLTTPWEGTGRYTDVVHGGSFAVALTVIQGPIVPDDRQWWMPYCEVYHDDPALTSHMWIEIRDRAGKDVAVSGAGDVTLNRHISIRRPLIIPEGGAIRGKIAVAPAAGQRITIRYRYVETELGEFIPAI